MRIAYLSNSYIPSRAANSIHVMKMSQALARAGHDVRLIAPDNPAEREQAVGDPWNDYGTEPIFEIAWARRINMKGGGYCYGWRAARMAQQWGAEVTYGRNLIACMFAVRRGMHVVLECHYPVESKGPLARLMFRILVRNRRFLRLIVITEALAHHYDRYWPELRGRVVVAPDGADPISDAVQPVDLGTSVSRLQVGYTGHLYQGKGAEHVLQIAQACPEYDFHLVGGTKEDLADWYARAELPDNLFLHGYRSHKEIAGYLLAFDVVLLPNQPEVHTYGGFTDIGRWTSPLKLFEYMAAGRAIVCSDLSVLQEVAENEKNVLICRHNSIQDWVMALYRLGQDAALRARLGTEARAQLQDRYSWDVRARRVLKHLHEPQTGHIRVDEG